ncbi:uncharacterized protein LTR77_008149 [Saxophila tyrrhenica]|uniref:NAD(P)-binding domain-containing protein n=1 Tax=Saxophila tyrrhenica TaxID=1690608 RepID=A0AAV9P2F8_9PEZI|nr:hypothetical protein LTR77_008149 [Saxophila tyrrhenica]
MPTPTPILLTGTTGGLGAKILSSLLHTHHIPPNSIIATSRTASNRSRYESQNLQFRVADYNRRATLDEAFANVENLLFMSSSERDNEKRNAEHANVIEAAKKAGVGRVWYVSLAFGSLGDGSKIGFQQAHYWTEDQLKFSGLNFISLRAGSYSDAFPLVLNWYPSTRTVLMPNLNPPVTESKVAFASRDELGEAMATLLVRGLEALPSVQPRTEKNIILLTGPKAESIVDLVGAINRGRRTDVGVEYLEPEEWIEASAKDDEGGKGRAWFEARLVFVQGLCDGDAELVDPALETLLGRRPESGTETVERLVSEKPGYTWHQNHAR